MRVLAIDPGRTTGYCYAAIRDAKLYFCPYQSVDDVAEFYHRIAKFEPEHIIVEDFAFRGGARRGLDLFPVQLIGVARLYDATHNIILTMQMPSEGKSYYSDKTLQSKGFYKRGTEHGRDASRHLLQWATFGPGYKWVEEAELVEMEAFDI